MKLKCLLSLLLYYVHREREPREEIEGISLLKNANQNFED